MYFMSLYQVLDTFSTNKTFIARYQKFVHMKIQQGRVDPNIWTAYEIVRDRMSQNLPITYLNLKDSTEYLNKKICGKDNLSSSQVKTLIKNGIIRSDTIELIKDKIGRQMLEYQIYQSDLDTFAELLQVFYMFLEIDVIKFDTNPENGKEAIYYRMFTKSDKMRMDANKAKANAVAEIFKSPFIYELVKELHST
jgi:hypothetical protein